MCGETYPLGCRFAPSIASSQFFSVNPDRRRRLYNTPAGMYEPHCGLSHVHTSWSAAEYLHQALRLNQCRLPEEALFVIRCGGRGVLLW